MVKLTNPLFSHQAHGRIGGIVYEGNRYCQYAKAYTPQRYKPTAAQIQQNYFFGEAADAWRDLPEEEKQEYRDRAVGMKMSGYNLFIKENIEHP